MVLIEARAGDLVPPPLLLLTGPTTFATLLGALDEPEADGAWDAPLGDDLTVTEAKALVGELACGDRDGERLRWCTDGQPLIPLASPRSFGEPAAARGDADFVERYLRSHLPFVTERSEAIQTSVGGGIWPLAGFGALAGAGLVAASASLWFDRRRRAVTLLSVRGVSPAGLGLKAVLELSIPLVSGVAVGVLAAHAMVVRLGPSPVLEPSALRDAVALGAAALVGAALTVGAVVAWRSRPHAAHAGGSRRLAGVPWELLLVWMTVVSYGRLGDWGVPIGRGADVSRVDLVALMFPVLFLVTVVAVVSRLLGWLARSLRARSRWLPPALYLGVRRVTRYRVAILGLLAASAIAAGVLGYAATMRRSLDATLQAKAKTYVGSDVTVRLDADDALPAQLEERSTTVDLYRFATLGPTEQDASVIAIDPDTFARAAFWDPSFADPSLGAILEALDRSPGEDGVPAVVVGTDAEPGTEVAVLDQGTRRFTIDPIDGVRTFPGMRLPKPTVFVRQDALADLTLVTGRREVWIAGNRDATLQALEGAGLGYVEDRQVGEVVDGASFRTVTWTFGFMQSLGASAGLLALGGVVVYLDARRRERLLGYAFMRRMGLGRVQHRRALTVELLASVVVGTCVGLASAVTAAWLAHDRVDPVPRFQPDPLLLPAAPLIVGLAALSLVVVLVAAALAQRRVDRDDPVEVLRAGT
jgi:putative ABC transport system permease protein